MITTIVPATATVAGVPHPVSSWWLTLDQGWVPYAHGEIVVPATPEAVALDPRTVTRVQLHAGQRWMDSLSLADLSTAWAGLTLADLSTAWAGLTLADLSAEWAVLWGNPAPRAASSLVADLVVRTSTHDLAADTVTLSVSSDESLAAESGALLGYVDAAESLGMRLTKVLSSGYLPARLAPDAKMTASLAAAGGDALVATPVLMDRITAAGDEVAVRVWCDETGLWRATDPLAAPTSTVHLSRVMSAVDTIDRDGDWADMLRLTVTDPVSDTIVTRPVSPSARPYRMAQASHARGNLGGAGIDALADAMLARLTSRGRTLTLTAPLDLDLRPGMGFTTGDPSLPALSGQIAAVEWRVSPTSADMTITTRDTVQED